MRVRVGPSRERFKGVEALCGWNRHRRRTERGLIWPSTGGHLLSLVSFFSATSECDQRGKERGQSNWFSQHGTRVLSSSEGGTSGTDQHHFHRRINQWEIFSSFPPPFGKRFFWERSAYSKTCFLSSLTITLKHLSSWFPALPEHSHREKIRFTTV